MLWWTLRKLKSKNWSRQNDAIKELCRSSDRRAVTPLLELLGQRYDSDVAKALGRFRERRAVPVLIEVLQDQSPGRDREWIRWDATEALAEIGDPRAIPPLIHALADYDPRLSTAAAVALARLQSAGVPDVEGQLLRLFTDGDYKDRRTAAKALAACGSRRAVAPMIEALADRSVSPEEVAPALARIADARAVPALIKAFEHPQNTNHDIQAIAVALAGFHYAGLAKLTPEMEFRARISGEVCANCLKPELVRGSVAPNGVCSECHRRVRNDLATHKGPWCHNCGRLYASSDGLPLQYSDQEEGRMQPYCPRCNSGSIY